MGSNFFKFAETELKKKKKRKRKDKTWQLGASVSVLTGG
jgi:hypothetical protein